MQVLRAYTEDDFLHRSYSMLRPEFGHNWLVQDALVEDEEILFYTLHTDILRKDKLMLLPIKNWNLYITNILKFNFSEFNVSLKNQKYYCLMITIRNYIHIADGMQYLEEYNMTNFA